MRNRDLHMIAALVPAIGCHMGALGQLAGVESREPTTETIRVIDHSIPEAVLAYWRSLPEARPAVRGFRAPILDHMGESWPLDEKDVEATPELKKASEIVATRLARDGLMSTLAQVIEALGPAKFTSGKGEELTLLRSVGLPVDLLGCFRLPESLPSDGGAADAGLMVQLVSKLLASGRTSQTIKPILDGLVFEFHKSRADFQVATESGEHDIGTIRLQLTRGNDWEGIGDGGNIDLTRQLIEKLPDVNFIASVETKFRDEFVALAKTWPVEKPGRLTVISEPLMVAQWAQDNGKAGLIGDKAAGTQAIATIVPRYASRGEDGSTFVPGESLLLDGIAKAVEEMTVFQSPLLFQGGNLLAVHDPATKRRVMLIGEAEIYRNTALGLTPPQVLEAFKIEFGVDLCLVLPAVSFHLDYDVSIRAHNGKLLAFVNDTQSAVKIILECGRSALEAHNLLDRATAATAREYLDADRIMDAIELIGKPVLERSNGGGHFQLALAEAFSTSSVDSGVGNLQRFLLAMDTAIAMTMAAEDVPDDRYAGSYLQSLFRHEADRMALHKRLVDWGFEVVAIPSLADGARSITYLNGLHDRTRYVIPTYGGLYAPLDAAAVAAFRRALGEEISIVPVLSSESQRRVGAVHCSCSAYPNCR